MMMRIKAVTPAKQTGGQAVTVLQNTRFSFNCVYHGRLNGQKK